MKTNHTLDEKKKKNRVETAIFSFKLHYIAIVSTLMTLETVTINNK